LADLAVTPSAEGMRAFTVEPHVIRVAFFFVLGWKLPIWITSSALLQIVDCGLRSSFLTVPRRVSAFPERSLLYSFQPQT